MSQPIRKRVVFRGRVQGVGFRANAHAIAQGHAVAGYVRNQSDGTVELLVEGTPEEVECCVQTIHVHFSRNIDDLDIETVPAGEPLSGFDIRW